MNHIIYLLIALFVLPVMGSQSEMDGTLPIRVRISQKEVITQDSAARVKSLVDQHDAFNVADVICENNDRIIIITTTAKTAKKDSAFLSNAFLGDSNTKSLEIDFFNEPAVRALKSELRCIPHHARCNGCYIIIDKHHKIKCKEEHIQKILGEQSGAAAAWSRFKMVIDGMRWITFFVVVLYICHRI